MVQCGHGAFTHLDGALLGKELWTVGQFRDIVIEERRHPDAGLQIFPFAIEVELILSLRLSAGIAGNAVGTRHGLAEVLDGGARWNDGQVELRGEAGVGLVQFLVHLGLVNVPFGKTPIVRRIGPGLLNIDFGLRSDAADFV